MRGKKWQDVNKNLLINITKASFTNSDLRGYGVSRSLRLSQGPQLSPFLKVQQQTLQSVLFCKNFVIIELLYNIFCR